MQLVFFFFLPFQFLVIAYIGDLTHYTPGSVSAPGSCGIAWTPGQDVVALSHIYMQSEKCPNGNSNPRCGWKINIYAPETGETHLATVIDTCRGCAIYSIDVNKELFDKIAPKGDGRVHSVKWEIVEGNEKALEREGTEICESINGDSTNSKSTDWYSTNANKYSTNSDSTKDRFTNSDSTIDQSIPVPSGWTACSIPGEIVCSIDGKMFGTCETNMIARMMFVAIGTICKNGQIGWAKRNVN